MHQEILFLRHGKAARPAGIHDFDRPLARRGEAQARKIGAWLKAHRAVPDAVLSSPAKRAYDTACLALDACGLDRKHVRTDPRLYFDTKQNLMAALRSGGDAEVGARLLVVGHNPWMEALVLDLAHERPPHPGGNWYMKTGALMRFRVVDLQDGLAPQCGALLDHVLADALPD